MTTYRVGIARRADGSADAWVFDLPGCRATAGSVEDVMNLLPVVIAEHHAWLKTHGETVPDHADWRVVEEIEGRGEFCFEADKAPIGDDEIEVAISRAGYAHADFVALARPLPDVVLDWRPPASAVKIDAIFPDVRSIRQMLEHVVGTEAVYYLGSLSDEAPSVPPAELDGWRLQESTAQRLRGLSAEQRSRVYRRQGRDGREMQWTARKVIRRLITHKRFHTREIEQRLCWLTLGVPEVLPVGRE